MPLPDHKIIQWAEAGGVRPFVRENVNPASLDLRVSRVWRDMDDPDELIYSNDMTIYPRTFFVEMYNLFAKIFHLPRKHTALMAITEEFVDIRNGMAAMLKLKSTPIREGLGYPIADWIDPGYSGHLTMLLTANRKVTIHSGQRIVQIVIEEMEMSNEPYYLKGHYNNQFVPTLSWRHENDK